MKPGLAGWLSIFFRGCAMGAADLVPGVSGGTIAFISGIYERLISAIASLDIRAVRLVLKGDIKAAWQHIDGAFLLALALGILSAIFTLAHLIESLVENQPVLIWSFFSGLILASILFLLRRVWPRSIGALIFVFIGAVFAYGLGELHMASMPVTPVFVFCGGFIAISAMLLPGVSGSFLLLILGLYQPTLEAVTNLDFAYLAVFALGAGAGFVVFSRAIRWLLSRYHDQTLLFLTGLLIGSLYSMWPWKGVDAEGLPINLWPGEIANMGGDAQVGFALLCLLSGFVLVVAVTFAGSKNDAKST